MFSIEPCSIPDGALLGEYCGDGTYTDCYTTILIGSVSHAQYVMAFYTTLVFKLERLILKWLVSKPSTDIQARHLAEGSIDAFSAWYVENRSENQLLMCDFQGRTRSWLMVITEATNIGTRTHLYFGSAVVPINDAKTGKVTMGFGFRALLGFHKLYSVVLLYAAKSRLVTKKV